MFVLLKLNGPNGNTSGRPGPSVLGIYLAQGSRPLSGGLASAFFPQAGRASGAEPAAAQISAAPDPGAARKL